MNGTPCAKHWVSVEKTGVGSGWCRFVNPFESVFQFIAGLLQLSQCFGIGRPVRPRRRLDQAVGQTRRSGGVEPRKAVAHGYVALVIDALGPRNAASVCLGPQKDVTFARGVRDALQGAAHLRRQPYVDDARVARGLGIPVGTVSSLERDATGLMQVIEVAPAARLARLRLAFVAPGPSQPSDGLVRPRLEVEPQRIRTTTAPDTARRNR